MGSGRPRGEKTVGAGVAAGAGGGGTGGGAGVGAGADDGVLEGGAPESVTSNSL